MDKVLFSTGKDDWETPPDLFDRLNTEFAFTLDPCADMLNHKCDKFYTMEEDGLSKSWEGETVFCNPPYSKRTTEKPGQEAWIKKCYNEAKKKRYYSRHADTGEDRHEGFSRVHFRHCRNTVYSWARSFCRGWGTPVGRAFSEHGRDISRSRGVKRSQRTYLMSRVVSIFEF